MSRYELFLPPLSKEPMKDTICFTAMSADGQKIAIAGVRSFQIFGAASDEPVSSKCKGEFTRKGKDFKYSNPRQEMSSQLPLPPTKYKVGQFSCLAVSNQYLAVGSLGRMMIFMVEGENGGRWIVDIVYDSSTSIEKLAFSANGMTLLALLKCEINGKFYSKALFYSTENWEFDSATRQSPTPVHSDVQVKWIWERDRPTAVTFSGDGMMVAISTTSDSEGKAKIRLLKFVESEWRTLGFQRVPVFPVQDRYGKGITGLALYVYNSMYC
jgi:hypothetical protein